MAKKKQSILSKVYGGFLHIDVFGETVETALVMEATSEPMKIQVRTVTHLV